MATQLTSDGIRFNDNTVQITKTTRQGRNRIINGAMEVAQRGTLFSPASGYTLDRYINGSSGTSAISISQNTDVPLNSGLSYSLRITVTTADASITTNDHSHIIQSIEGYNIADLVGTAFTLSFWVRSSKIGIHCIRLINSGRDKCYNAEYSINLVNTWEKKSITITNGLPTTGTWDFTNGLGLAVSWTLANGPVYQAPSANVWNSANYLGTANQVNCLDTVGNIFAIAGVQLEEGSVATEFEKTPYDIELVKCQRYYQIAYASTRSYCAASSVLTSPVQYYTTMRTDPTVVLTAGSRSANLSAVSIVAHATTASHRLQTNATAGDTYALNEKCEFTAEL